MTEKNQRQIFNNWLNAHKGLIFKVVRAYAFNATDRDDLFQEIIIQVWRSVPRFREESSVTTWLYRISLNTAIKWMEKEQKHDHLKWPAICSTSYRRAGHRRPAFMALRRIYRLDAIDRSITLLLLDDFSYKEIADLVGISESNVGVKINRIKKHLVS